jgi:hypothetical protein
MENYGFTLVTTEEARQFGLPNNSGLFNELFDSMENEIKQNPKKKSEYKTALNMSSAEKSLSFLNRYFIFRKSTSVKAADIEKEFLKKTKMGIIDDSELELLESQIDEQRKTMTAIRGRIKKLKATIVLQKFITPIEIRQQDESEEILDIQNISNQDEGIDVEEQEEEEEEKEETEEYEDKRETKNTLDNMIKESDIIIQSEKGENREVLQEVKDPFITEEAEPEIKLKAKPKPKSKSEIILKDEKITIKKKKTRKVINDKK